MSLKTAIAYLHALPRFAGREGEAYKPGLERIRALLVAMGEPHRAFRSAHVAGTNGKGTTVSLLAAVASAAGLRVGLHTSPHLVHLTERMRMGGRPAPEAWLADAAARYRSAFEEVGPSFFEATVALSFRYFADQSADLAVVEVGLGGRLDATNILAPSICAITSIGREHTELLGATLGAIAREKAGIIKASVPVITAVEQPEALTALQEIATGRAAPLHRVHEEVELGGVQFEEDGLVIDAQTPVRLYEGLRIALYGRHQVQNALVALRMAEELLETQSQPSEVIKTGFAEVHDRSGLRGRFQILQRRPLVVLDVAHNPDSLAATLRALRDHFGPRRGRLVVALGLMRDKDAVAMAQLLAAAGAAVRPVALPSDRALPAGALAAVLEAAGTAVGPAGSAPEVLRRFRDEAARNDALLICGSHQTVAPLLAV